MGATKGDQGSRTPLSPMRAHSLSHTHTHTNTHSYMSRPSAGCLDLPRRRRWNAAESWAAWMHLTPRSQSRRAQGRQLPRESQDSFRRYRLTPCCKKWPQEITLKEVIPSSLCFIFVGRKASAWSTLWAAETKHKGKEGSVFPSACCPDEESRRLFGATWKELLLEDQP